MPHRMLIAPDKFKRSLTALQVAEAIAQGIRQLDPTVECDLCPIADEVVSESGVFDSLHALARLAP